jgi:DNA-binding response OmpR family regulator
MKKKKVLIVDDDHGIRESLRDLLLLEQYECVVADTGTKGLYLLNQEQPDIVVLDLQLPDMSGFQFCQMFKKDDSLRHIPEDLVVDAVIEAWQNRSR